MPLLVVSVAVSDSSLAPRRLVDGDAGLSDRDGDEGGPPLPLRAPIMPADADSVSRRGPLAVPGRPRRAEAGRTAEVVLTVLLLLPLLSGLLAPSSLPCPVPPVGPFGAYSVCSSSSRVTWLPPSRSTALKIRMNSSLSSTTPISCSPVMNSPIVTVLDLLPSSVCISRDMPILRTRSSDRSQSTSASRSASRASGSLLVRAAGSGFSAVLLECWSRERATLRVECCPKGEPPPREEGPDPEPARAEARCRAEPPAGEREREGERDDGGDPAERNAAGEGWFGGEDGGEEGDVEEGPPWAAAFSCFSAANSCRSTCISDAWRSEMLIVSTYTLGWCVRGGLF